MSERRLPRPPSRIHVVGAGGSGMSGLAKLLSQLGFVVTGSDLKPGRVLDALRDVDVEAWVGHRPEALAGVDLVVASSAVPDRDPELAAARAAGITVWRRPTLLGALTALMPTYGFAGTHGKTTSTAMAVTVLRALGRDPTFLVGGEMVALNTGAHLGDRDVFLLEADEAFGTFRHLALQGLMVTNVEADHLDHYGTVTALEEAFAQVAAGVRGPVVGCLDDPGVRRLAQRATLVGYGATSDATWRLGDLVPDGDGVRFVLTGPEAEVTVRIPRPGRHVALDAAGVLALLGELGYDVGAGAAALAGFSGVRRRFEVRGRVAGITVVEDYAHHPTEVAATIAAGRQAVTGRLWAVFQPHRFTRTAELAPAFGAPLAGADRVVVTDVYPAGEAPVPGVSGKLVAEAATAAGGEVVYVPRLEDVPGLLRDEVAAGDLVLVLGAGDVGSIVEPLVVGLRER